jgi:signal transduction histidine kinase
MSIVESKIGSQIERADFKLHMQFEPEALAAYVLIDPDAFTQIVINLVDNAIKFSPADALRQIDLACSLERGNVIRFAVRDYGVGVPKDQLRKVFELFYRPHGELTRETPGTGIGLALVHQLSVAMRGRVDVCNCSPGAEFSVIFPAAG